VLTMTMRWFVVTILAAVLMALQSTPVAPRGGTGLSGTDTRKARPRRDGDRRTASAFLTDAEAPEVDRFA